MKIKRLYMQDFMLFNEASISWSNNINIICGENSTGKTTILKAMYSALKPFAKGSVGITSKEAAERDIVEKLQGVFRPDENKIGRLVSRVQGSNRTDFEIELDRNQKISIGF